MRGTRVLLVKIIRLIHSLWRQVRNNKHVTTVLGVLYPVVLYRGIVTLHDLVCCTTTLCAVGDLLEVGTVQPECLLIVVGVLWHGTRFTMGGFA